MRFRRWLILWATLVLAASTTFAVRDEPRDLTPSERIGRDLVRKVIHAYIDTRSAAEHQTVAVRQVLLCRDVYVPDEPYHPPTNLSAWSETGVPELPPQGLWEASPWNIWLVNRHHQTPEQFDDLYADQVYAEIQMDMEGQLVARVYWNSTESMEFTLIYDHDTLVIKETLLVKLKD